MQTELPPLNVVFQKAVPKAVFSEHEVADMSQEEWIPGFKRPTFVNQKPTEGELAERIEYDMDEQDMEWLKLVNEERRTIGEPAVPELVFELIMDRLEKEWFDMTKDLPKPVRDESSSEDTACAVCDDGECENSNAIVFCDGCNLAVHQGTLREPVYMEPIESIEAIPESRWKLQCYICKKRKGACIQCSSKNCYVAYHVTCARKVKLFMKMRVHSGVNDEVSMRSFCDRIKEHRDKVDMEAEIIAFRQAMDSKSKASVEPVSGDDEDDSTATGNGRKRSFKKIRRSNVRRIVDSEDDEPEISSSASRSARAHQSHYAPQIPVVPYAVAKKIAGTIKRSREGAPLLRRLHLEPWTATASATKEDENFRAMRNEILIYVRKDLERVRMLAELVKKREKEKLKRYQIQVQYLDFILNPVTNILRRSLRRLKSWIKNPCFLNRFNPEEVADYLDIVKEPMDFLTMSKKMEANDLNLSITQRDLYLICDNATLYNAPETMWGRAAPRIKAACSLL
ncbi:PHD-like zinc-binding domain-containing protein [Chytridium lagenaria]|nr:PHD-like zinc-binding domain-containing protein [Chytridium lagenaria]